MSIARFAAGIATNARISPTGGTASANWVMVAVDVMMVNWCGGCVVYRKCGWIIILSYCMIVVCSMFVWSSWYRVLCGECQLVRM